MLNKTMKAIAATAAIYTGLALAPAPAPAEAHPALSWQRGHRAVRHVVASAPWHGEIDDCFRDRTVAPRRVPLTRRLDCLVTWDTTPDESVIDVVTVWIGRDGHLRFEYTRHHGMVQR